mmetsp:Transcript_23218/g.39325  ORF Transcript_23218/g.39325 Transcript_23218/m.39325 type:complete len:192 (+) Transcript_23218:112-687(+)
MQGQEYLTINPDTFSDANTWSYKDLQILCKKLALGGRGTRDCLEEKLFSWHRERQHEDKPEEEKFEMNVPGNNFSLLQINVEPSKKVGKNTKRRKSSLLGLDDATTEVNPSILRPFNPQTPSKGILKKRPAHLDMESLELDEWTNATPRDQESNAFTPKKLSKLTFSPFNGVKVISHRHEELFGGAVELFT